MKQADWEKVVLETEKVFARLTPVIQPVQSLSLMVA